MAVIDVEPDPVVDTAEWETSIPPGVSTAMQQLTKFLPMIGPNRMLIIFSVGCFIVAAVADTFAVHQFTVIIDRALAAGDMRGFWGPAAEWIGLSVLGGSVMFAGSYLSRLAAENFVLRLRDRTFAWLLGLSPTFFARHAKGDLIARLSGDVEEVEELASSGLIQAATALPAVICFIIAAFIIRWDLALAAIAVLPLLAGATKHLSRRLQGLAQDAQAVEGAVTAVMEESITNAATIQAYGTESYEATRLHMVGGQWRRLRLQESRLSSLSAPLTDLLETLAVIAVLGLGAWDISHGRLTVGGLIGFATYLGFLYPPLSTLSGLAMGLASASASSQRVIELLDTPPAVTDPPNAQSTPPMTAGRGAVTVTDLSFSYPGATPPAISNVDFHVQPGQFLMITGPSGAGKSSLAQLLTRYYDPDHGTIEIDGVNIRDLSLHATRHNITLLHQQPAIFAGTIASNIAYGTLRATQEQINHAAVAAGVDEFTARLPDGLRTVLPAGGPNLSGGQRQRVALARALLRDSPILMMDEPTTGLDSLTRTELVPNLLAATRNRTTILITHDLALAPHAHHILVLDHGHLTEQGTHRHLMNHGILYPRLHQPHLEIPGPQRVDHEDRET